MRDAHLAEFWLRSERKKERKKERYKERNPLGNVKIECDIIGTWDGEGLVSANKSLGDGLSFSFYFCANSQDSYQKDTSSWVDIQK